ncbi:unnamed protein product, partial [Discosporangium mesarthrocarpum]
MSTTPEGPWSALRRRLTEHVHQVADGSQQSDISSSSNVSASPSREGQRDTHSHTRQPENQAGMGISSAFSAETSIPSQGRVSMPHRTKSNMDTQSGSGKSTLRLRHESGNHRAASGERGPGSSGEGAESLEDSLGTALDGSGISSSNSTTASSTTPSPLSGSLRRYCLCAGGLALAGLLLRLFWRQLAGLAGAYLILMAGRRAISIGEEQKRKQAALNSARGAGKSREDRKAAGVAGGEGDQGGEGRGGSSHSIDFAAG